MNMLNVSSSPHVRDKDSTRGIMLDVCIAMLPTAAFGVVQFGISALLVIIVTVLAAVLSEYLWQKGMHKQVTICDCSAVVTGLILALNMPSEIPLWIPALGAVFAIILVKQLFGGLGQNWMNPALAGRCFLLISCAKYMNNFSSAGLGFDATTGATPLAIMKSAVKAGSDPMQGVDLMQLFIGRVPGTIGEVSAVALLIGGIYLLWKKVISWHIPVIYIATVAVFVFIFGHQSADYVLAQVLGGGLIFGAFFMATDYVSTPLTRKGQIIYALLIGLLTGLFRIFGTGAEGVSYSIIIGNMLSPLIESATIPKAFGRRGAKK